METTNPTIGSLIDLAERGDGASAGKLFTLLYRELHRLAKRQLARQGAVSISATTLIHEAYLDIAAQEGRSFPDQGRFMAYAARDHPDHCSYRYSKLAARSHGGQ